MTNVQTHETDAFQRVKNFGIKYAADIPPASVGGQLFAKIAAAVPQAQTQAAVSPRDGAFSLLEWLEKPRQPLPCDADAGIGHLDDQPPRAIVDGADGDGAARREFHGVLDQVPEHLLEPRGIGLYMI